MKKTKHKHNSNRDQRKFDIDYIFRNQDPDKRTCRQWLNDMQKKHGINWINQRYTKQTITLDILLSKTRNKMNKNSIETQ